MNKIFKCHLEKTQMNCYPKTESVIPLIVVGPPRSGTRFLANILNSIPEVVIQGEIDETIMKHVVYAVKKFMKYQKHAVKSENVLVQHDKLASFLFSSWANLSKQGRIEADSKCLYYGYKNPSHEYYFNFYNAVFHPVRPIYLCCIRSFKDHYLSVQARWPDQGIPWVALKYIRSLRQIRYMLNQRPHEVHLFDLDAYKQRGFSYLVHQIFNPLGITSLQNAIRKADQGPVNTSEQLGVRKKDALSPFEIFFLRWFPFPEREYERFSLDRGQTSGKCFR